MDSNSNSIQYFKLGQDILILQKLFETSINVFLNAKSFSI